MNLIRLALEGREEAEHDLFTHIYGSQGIKLPPLTGEPGSGRHNASDAFKARLRSHNAALRANGGGRKRPAKKKAATRPAGGDPPAV